ncbi:unnamed protein product [Rotaria sp. Silwood2]|nr:unnamed protein product [Rotaria sp. Silwood2]
MSNGTIITVPNHIRNLIPSRIIVQYHQFCNETCPNTFKPLSKSILYEILDGCSASTRKSLQGLDYFSADGSTAFDNLINIANELLTIGVSDTVVRQLKNDLQLSRNYLKNDYKLHIHDGSTIPDHCSSFSLSDPHEKEWQQPCDHHHNDECEYCTLLENSFLLLSSLVKNSTNNCSPDKKKRLLHRIAHNIELIHDWKSHQLRTVNQEKARSEILENLDSKSVFIQIDWSMKFLAKEYRESQRQWFADNAGCFHGSEFLLAVKALYEETGIFIKRIDFSDPQSGKSCCDRMAAVIKCNIRRYIDEKHNVTNSKEFIEAARETKYLSLYASSTSRDQTQLKKKKLEWSGVKTFNNIEYSKTNISTPLQLQNTDKKFKPEHMNVKCWRAWKIGVGKSFLWKDLQEVTFISPLNVVDEFSFTNNRWLLESEENESVKPKPMPDNDEDNSIDENFDDISLSEFEVFDCPEVDCIKRFIKYGQLLNHLSTGKHIKNKEKISLSDTAKSLYQNKLEYSSTRQVPSLKDFIITRSDDVEKKKPLSYGWALTHKKTNHRLTPEQKKFLEDKYNQGEKENMKCTSVDVAHEMEILMNGNEYVFEPYQWLKSSQIQSFWSRLTKARRQSSQNHATTNDNKNNINTNYEYEADEDDLFEQVAYEVKEKILQKREQIIDKPVNDSVVTVEMSSLSMKKKQSQRSMDDFTGQQRKRRSVDK